MSIFYAESWELTHMLALSSAYTSQFRKFLAAISSGRSASDCLQSTYGQSLADVTKDLHAYLQQTTVRGAVFNVKLSKPELEPNVSDASESNIDLALADLLASRKNTIAEAADRLSRLANAHPESPDVQESLGYLAWEQGNLPKARGAFQLAFEKGSKDPEMLYHYSQLLRTSGASADQVLPPLQRAVSIKPDYWDAWFDLGMVATNARQWSVAVSAFSQIKTVTPERAYALFSALAYCNLQLKALPQARALAEKAKPYAKSPDEETQIANMLRHLDALEHKDDSPSAAVITSAALAAQTPAPDRPSGPTATRDLSREVPFLHRAGNLQHVDGVAKSFECTSNAPRLHVMVDSKEMVFEFDDPKDVIVRNATSSTINMQCGPQKPFKVGIYYVPSSQSSAIAGMVRELVF